MIQLRKRSLYPSSMCFPGALTWWTERRGMTPGKGACRWTDLQWTSLILPDIREELESSSSRNTDMLGIPERAQRLIPYEGCPGWLMFCLETELRGLCSGQDEGCLSPCGDKSWSTFRKTKMSLMEWRWLPWLPAQGSVETPECGHPAVATSRHMRLSGSWNTSTCHRESDI